MKNKKSVYILQESEEEIRRFAEPLEACGYVIAGSSCSGSEAINEVIKSKPDFFVLGLDFQKTNGLEVIKRTYNPDIKIIVISTIDSEETIKDALAAGAVYFISKPIEASVIVSLIKELSEKLPDYPPVKDDSFVA